MKQRIHVRRVQDHRAQDYASGDAGHALSYSEVVRDSGELPLIVEMLADAYQDLCDVALLISADSDLTAPVVAIKSLFPEKRVVVAFPPQRHSAQLQRFAHASLPIGRATLAKSVFPDDVAKADGFVLRKPGEWR